MKSGQEAAPKSPRKDLVTPRTTLFQFPDVFLDSRHGFTRLATWEEKENNVRQKPAEGQDDEENEVYTPNLRPTRNTASLDREYKKGKSAQRHNNYPPAKLKAMKVERDVSTGKTQANNAMELKRVVSYPGPVQMYNIEDEHKVQTSSSLTKQARPSSAEGTHTDMSPGDQDRPSSADTHGPIGKKSAKLGSHNAKPKIAFENTKLAESSDPKPKANVDSLHSFRYTKASPTLEAQAPIEDKNSSFAEEAGEEPDDQEFKMRVEINLSKLQDRIDDLTEGTQQQSLDRQGRNRRSLHMQGSKADGSTTIHGQYGSANRPFSYTSPTLGGGGHKQKAGDMQSWLNSYKKTKKSVSFEVSDLENARLKMESEDQPTAPPTSPVGSTSSSTVADSKLKPIATPSGQKTNMVIETKYGHRDNNNEKSPDPKEHTTVIQECDKDDKVKEKQSDSPLKPKEKYFVLPPEPEMDIPVDGPLQEVKRMEEFKRQRALRELEPPRHFTNPPPALPLVVCMDYYGTTLNHKDVKLAVYDVFESTPAAEIVTLQFVARNVALDTKWLTNRWLITVNVPIAVSLLVGKGVRIANQRVPCRRYEHVLKEEYNKYLDHKNKKKIIGKTGLSENNPRPIDNLTMLSVN